MRNVKMYKLENFENKISGIKWVGPIMHHFYTDIFYVYL